MALRDWTKKFWTEEVSGSLLPEALSHFRLEWLLKKSDGQKPQETRKAVTVILDLYPRKKPQDIQDDRVNNAEWFAGQGKGDPEHIAICQTFPSHEERNQRIREHIATREDRDNLDKRHERLTWYENIPDGKKEELELLHDTTLKQIFSEDDPAERDMILQAVVEKTLTEKIGDATRHLSDAWDQLDQRARQMYTQFDPSKRAIVDRWHRWAESRTQRREQGAALAVNLARWLVFVPGITGVVIIVVAFIRVLL